MSRKLWLFAAYVGFSWPVLAATFKPSDPKQVLEVLTKRNTVGFADPEVLQLKRELAKDPKNIQLAVQLASKLVAFGRKVGDPRPFGQAQAALRPWWDEQRPPAPILYQRAVIWQFNHEFQKSLTDLAAYLEDVPEDNQARLVQATVMQVTGDFDGAKRSCDMLVSGRNQILKSTCNLAAQAMLENPDRSYQQFKKMADLGAFRRGTSEALHNYMLSVLADIAAQLNLMDDSIAYRQSVLRSDPGDIYNTLTLVDALIDLGRVSEAESLVCDRPEHDGFLLRCARTQRLLKKGEFDKSKGTLQERFDAELQRGSSVHLRERAYFDLYIREEPRDALGFAKENWQTQKELIDARLLLESAVKARDKATNRTISDWLKAHFFQTEILMQLRESLLGQSQ